MGLLEGVIYTISNGVISPDAAGDALQNIARTIQPALYFIREALNIPR